MLDRELTLIFDEGVEGFTSFQTYAPDSGLSINNRFFSFKRGILWEHHIDGVDRNEFYDVNNNSFVSLIFNDEPSSIKNFKTMGYEGTKDWGVTVTTDQESIVTDTSTIPVTRESSGSIANEEFVTREGKHFGYIRGTEEDVSNLSLERITVQGLGQGTLAGGNIIPVNVVNIPADLSIGDTLYFFQNNGDDTYQDALLFLGTVTALDRVTGDITYTFNILFGALQPANGDFILYSKSAVSETSGVIGFFAIADFRSSATDMVELFSVTTEAFISSN